MVRSVPHGLVLALAVTACTQDPVRVENRPSADYGRAALHQAVTTFVKAGRTPAAYAALSARARELLPTMDKAVADETELKLTVLALAPTLSVKERALRDQAEALATTVWPTAFSDPFRPPALGRAPVRDQAELQPTSTESAAQYMLRICGGPLSQVCRDIVPEYHAPLLAAHAVHRFNERSRSAIADCLVCESDPSWRAAARGWEELDTINNSWLREVTKAGAPSNWPAAGAGSEVATALPTVTLSALGELVIADKPVPASQVDRALRELLGGRKEAALHARPDVPLARLRELMADLHAAGATTVALVAREPRYPWDLRHYRAALGRGRRVDVRSNDTLQVVLRQIDVAGVDLTRLD